MRAVIFGMLVGGFIGLLWELNETDKRLTKLGAQLDTLGMELNLRDMRQKK